MNALYLAGVATVVLVLGGCGSRDQGMPPKAGVVAKNEATERIPHASGPTSQDATKAGSPLPGGPKVGSASEAVTGPGDQAAATELEKLGARLTRDDRGVVRGLAAKGDKFNDAAMAQLPALAGLETLDLNGCAITDAGWVHLRKLTSLQSLYLHDIPVSDDALVNLEGLADLTVLMLGKSRVAGPGLAHLKPLVNLEVLNLSHSPITDDALTHLKGMEELNTLGLEGTKVTDAGLVHLEPLAKLRVLNLSRTAVTDKGLGHLRHLTELRMLYLEEDQVDQENVGKFRKKMPGLAVYF